MSRNKTNKILLSVCLRWRLVYIKPRSMILAVRKFWWLCLYQYLPLKVERNVTIVTEGNSIVNNKKFNFY